MLYFFHGLNGYPNEWKPFIEIFSNHGYKCHAMDFKKGLDLKKIRFQDYIDLIVEKINDKDILIGHSMGGLIVQKVAEETNIKAGVCICPASLKGIEINKVSILSQIRYVPNIIFNTPFKPSFNLAYQLFLSKMPEKKARMIYKKLEVQSAIVSYEVLRSKIEVDETKVKCPLLFIGRNNDAIIPVDCVEKIAKKYNATFKRFDGNHYIYDDASIISDVIYDFIKDK